MRESIPVLRCGGRQSHQAVGFSVHRGCPKVVMDVPIVIGRRRDSGLGRGQSRLEVFGIGIRVVHEDDYIPNRMSVRRFLPVV